MFKKTFIPILMLGTFTVTGLTSEAAADSWTPRASDRLIKLPGNILKKAVDKDFAKSGLAEELAKTEEKVTLKKGTLADLQAAVETADGDLQVELQHQFLTEKRRYLELMRDQQDIRRKRALTKVRLYERLLAKMNAKQAAATPAQAQLLERQRAAQERFNSSLQAVDTKLFRSTLTEQSKYGRDYAKNMAAIDNLVQAINAHPLNRAPELNGQPVTQADYLRQLVAENEAEVALVNQERAILGYMAKLVSLDALALSEDVASADEMVADSAGAQADAAASVSFFINR